jgi:hypothetical protein
MITPCIKTVSLVLSGDPAVVFLDYMPYHMLWKRLDCRNTSMEGIA